MRNRSSGAISRVLYPWAVTHPTGVCHLSRMVVTYHLVRSTLRLGRATLVASVYMTLQPIGCTAACIATHSGELLPHLFTITAGDRVLRGCHSLLHLPTLTDSFPLGSMALCVARTFLTRPSATKEVRDRPPHCSIASSFISVALRAGSELARRCDARSARRHCGPACGSRYPSGYRAAWRWAHRRHRIRRYSG